MARWVDDVVIVGEDETAEAMVLLMERCKLVVEGAGAVGRGAAGRARGAGVVRHDRGGPVGRQRRPGAARLDRAPARDRGRPPARAAHARARPPGRAGELLECVASTGANIVDVSHVREGLDLHVRETAVELVLETRGHEHAERVLGAMDDAGYEARVLH